MDAAHDWTDERIAELEARMQTVYDTAASEMADKLKDFLGEFDSRNEKMKAKVASGEITQKDYDDWLKFQSNRQVWLNKMAEELATDATRVDQLAMDYVNDELPNVYCENVNYSFYGIETEIGFDTHSFTLYDQKTVALMLADPDAVRYPTAKLDEEKDAVWNYRKMNEALTQSILQGESIPNTAKRLRSVLDMDRRVATRVARTTMTSAENAGRVESYRVADKAGVRVHKQWMATIDMRTRYSHRLMNGVHVPYDRPFVVGPNEKEMMHPADPKGPPEEVYNCRCTLVGWVEGIEAEDPEQWSDLPEGMTYEEWLKKARDWQEKAKERLQEGQPKDESGPTIAGVKRGKPMTFERANELRGNPKYNMADGARDRRDAAVRAYNSAVDNYGFNSKQFLDAVVELDEADKAFAKAQKEQATYRINCQTCVVANEARRRGYDVQATANVKGSVNERVARQTNLAWIDPTTGKHPEYIRYDGEGKKDYRGRPIPTHARYVKWLESDGVVEEGARYTIEFDWKGRSRYGHIVSLERTDEGLRIYDPQSGKSYVGGEVREYLKKVKYKTTIGGTQIAYGPELLKVSDYEFDIDICNEILMGAESDT